MSILLALPVAFDDHRAVDIRELASHLNLSIGTVSRAFNGQKDVNPATRQRVIDAAAQFGYAPNQSGRSLRRGRTGAVGFMLPIEHESAIYGAPFFMGLLEGVQERLSEHGLDLIVLLARPGEDGLEVLRRHVSRGVADGWLLSATQRHDPRIPFLIERRMPFVTLGRTGHPDAHAWIDMDFESVVQQSFARFVAGGHTRIGLIAPPATINNSHIVAECYRRNLTLAGLPFDPELLQQSAGPEIDGRAMTHALMQLPSPPTALLVIGETAPIGVYQALASANLVPGRDVAVIGLRDNPALSVLRPALTCFDMALPTLGIRLADAMLDVLGASGQPEIPTQTLWPMALRARESG